MKLFKPNDPIEQKFSLIPSPLTSLISSESTIFFDNAFICFLLGDVLFNLRRDPLVAVVNQEVYRSSFPAIHELFTRPGTFEFYMDVFRAVWGDDVDVEFVIPSPGVLEININALGIRLDGFSARRIEDNAYVYEEVVDHEGDTILFQGTQGLRTQREAEGLVNELHPAGVIVETTLTIGV